MSGTLEHLGWALPTEPVRRLVDLRTWQAGRCAMCRYHDRRPNWVLDLDHDHDTGLVRGYLCKTCNAQEWRSDAPEWREWRSGATPAGRLALRLQYSANAARKAIFDSYVQDEWDLDRIAEAVSVGMDPGDPGWEEWVTARRALHRAHAEELAELIYDPRRDRPCAIPVTYARIGE